MADAGGGANSILAPKKKPWFATFGWANPCTTTGDLIVVDDVRYQFKVTPLSVRTLAFDARRWRGTTGIGSTKGTPQAQLASDEVRGKILGPAEGFKVTVTCGEASQSEDQLLQLLTVLKAGARGAEVTDYLIDYTAGGKDYTLKVNWQLVACGTATSPNMCQP
ncbi:UNVERIFIED_CONTAM: hypothetical protein LK11_18275 [Mumia flava]